MLSEANNHSVTTLRTSIIKRKSFFCDTLIVHANVIAFSRDISHFVMHRLDEYHVKMLMNPWGLKGIVK